MDYPHIHFNRSFQIKEAANTTDDQAHDGRRHSTGMSIETTAGFGARFAEESMR